jgi:hypothetical protein
MHSPSHETHFDKVIATAVPTRIFVAAFSVYLMLTGLLWQDDGTRHIFGLEALDIRVPLVLCGIGVFYAVWRELWLGVLWTIFVGVACIGRFLTIVLLDGSTQFDDVYEQVRALGWVFFFLFALTCVIQITAARALEGGQWSG